MKKSEQFKLLVRNSFRILNKSKLLMSQLSFLVVMGMSITLTISLSNTLLNQSKNNIVKNGELADFTISIPTNIRNESINNSDQYIVIPTDSPVDLELQQKLNDLGLYFSITNNVNLSDVQTNSNFIAYEIDNDANVNKLITSENVELPTSKYSVDYLNEISKSIQFVKMSSYSFAYIKSNYDYYANLYKYENYINSQP